MKVQLLFLQFRARFHDKQSVYPVNLPACYFMIPTHIHLLILSHPNYPAQSPKLLIIKGNEVETSNEECHLKMPPDSDSKAEEFYFGKDVLCSLNETICPMYWAWDFSGMLLANMLFWDGFQELG